MSARVVVVPDEVAEERRTPAPQAPKPAPRPVPSATAILGRAAVALVVLLALFVGYLRFGSGLTETRAQRLAFERFSTLLPTGELDALDTPIPLGSPVALIVIPSIGVSQVVSEGTTGRDLMKGPGHLPSAPLPGEYGNAVIMGRAHSYGRPFAALGTLQVGDKIQVTTGQGAFLYAVQTVQTVAAHSLVTYSGVTGSRLTIVTASPGFAPSQHLVVVAKLDGDPIGVATRPSALLRDGDLAAGQDPMGILGTILWGAILAAGVLGAIRLYRRWPFRAAYLVCAPVLVFVLWQFYASLSTLLPGVW
jgi:sortase A